MMEQVEFDPALISRYLERRNKDLALIESALANENFPVIANLGHQWKGNGLSFGFPELADLGCDLEAAAEANDKDQITELLPKIRSFVETHQP
jgi:HPt (histidine-containing phosphotransfer) domain-containing protein